MLMLLPAQATAVRSAALGVLAAILALGLTAPAPAQAGPLGGGSTTDGSGTRLVDAEDTVETATQSFRTTAERLVETIADRHQVDQSERRSEMQRLADDASAQFRQAVTDAIDELRGDGVLQLDEVTGRLAEVRERRLAMLRQRLAAAAEGAAAPPVRKRTAPLHDYIGDLLAYTLLERNSATGWLGLLAWVVGGVALAWGVARVLGAIGGALRRRGRRASATLLATLTGPLYLTAAITGVAAGLRHIWIPVAAEDFVWLVVKLTFAAASFWLVWNLCGAVATMIGWAAHRSRSEHDNQIVEVVRTGLRLFALVVFALFVTEVLFDTDLKGLLAGVGILGLAISFAAQDTLKNVIASFTIFSDRPYRIGDLLLYDDRWCEVEEIGFRSTRIRTWDGHLITVPNNQMITQPVTNVSARPSIRRLFHLDLPYGTTTEKVREAMEILDDILSDSEGIRQDDPPRVVFDGFHAYSLRLLVQYFYQPPDYWQSKAHDSEINLQIMRRFDEAGLSFAFPTQTSVLTTDDEQPPHVHLESNAAVGAGADHRSASRGESESAAGEAEHGR